MATETPANRDDFVHESPFAKLLDMRVADPEDGTSTVVMPINPNHLQLAGRVQGGILVALADYSMFRAIRPLLKPGEGTTTIELKINFLAAAEKGEVEAQENRDRLMELLDIDTEVAEVLVDEGFTTLEEVAYVPVQELLQVEEFDEELVEELRRRAKETLLVREIAEQERLSPNEDLLTMEGI